ncbi:unnamed protein product, partial [Polarella glacialis]
ARPRLGHLQRLLFAVAAWQLLGNSSLRAFSHPAAGASGRAGSAASRSGDSADRMRRRATNEKFNSPKTEKWLQELLVPEKDLYEVDDDGMVLRERFPGGRTFFSTFWAIIQPFASFGFLVVGASTFFGENIVDWTPVTKSLLGFLKPSAAMSFIPQGAFMSFYGFFGFFVFGLPQWIVVIFNKGVGCIEFNKTTKTFYIVRDGDLLFETPLDEIQQVKFVYTNFFSGDREIFLIMKDGSELKWMETVDDNVSKRVLERRASILADFLEKELIVEDA